MTYVTKEVKTVEVEKIVKPSDVYRSKERIAEILLTHRVTRFGMRESIDELGISANMLRVEKNISATEPRFFVEPYVKQTIDEVWE